MPPVSTAKFFECFLFFKTPPRLGGGVFCCRLRQKLETAAGQVPEASAGVDAGTAYAALCGIFFEDDGKDVGNVHVAAAVFVDV